MATNNQNNPSASAPHPRRTRRKPKGRRVLGMVGKVLGTLVLIGICTGAIMACFAAVYIQTIIMPQAVKNILPTLGNEFITLVKETSVVSFVAASDLYVAFNYIGSNSYDFMVPYLVMAAIYIVLVLVISLLVKLLERSLRKSDRRN